VIYLSPRFYLDTGVDPSPPPLQAAGKGLIPYSEVNKHDNEGDCWVVINGKVYDLTEVRFFFILIIGSGG
jgi:L-lactate dehydrogenase (cytochrome)